MHYQEHIHAEPNCSLYVWFLAISPHRMSKCFLPCDCFLELAWGCGLPKLVTTAPFWRCFSNGRLSLCRRGRSSFHFWGSAAISTPSSLYFVMKSNVSCYDYFFVFCGLFFFWSLRNTDMVWGRGKTQCKIFLSKIYSPDKKLFIVTYDISELWVVVEFSI